VLGLSEALKGALGEPSGTEDEAAMLPTS
jgi:hypothetical protein